MIYTLIAAAALAPGAHAAWPGARGLLQTATTSTTTCVSGEGYKCPTDVSGFFKYKGLVGDSHEFDVVSPFKEGDDVTSYFKWSMGPCGGACTGDKVEEVMKGGLITTIKVPKGECAGQPMCIYAHDGSYKLNSPTGAPASCYDNAAHPCNLCKFEVTPYVSMDTMCSDGKTCTKGDVCDGKGKCMGTRDDAFCDDKKGCTTDSCSPDLEGADKDSGCVNKKNDDFCNDSASCSDEKCDPANEKAGADDGCVRDYVNERCDDKATCSTETCEPKAEGAEAGTGCKRVYEDIKCVDDYECTTDECKPKEEGADAVTGCKYMPVDAKCDDQVGCTDDSCKVGEGCVYTPVNEKCDDGYACTDDVCDKVAGCKYTPVDNKCDDNVACSKDTCEPSVDTKDKGGCKYTPVDEDCADVSECYEGTCDLDAGKCTYTPVDEKCKEGVCDKVDSCVCQADGTCKCDAKDCGTCKSCDAVKGCVGDVAKECSGTACEVCSCTTAGECDCKPKECPICKKCSGGDCIIDAGTGCEKAECPGKGVCDDTGACKCPVVASPPPASPPPASPPPVQECTNNYSVVCYKCGVNTDCFIDGPAGSLEAAKTALTATCVASGSDTKVFKCSNQQCNKINFYAEAAPACPTIQVSKCKTLENGQQQLLSNFAEYSIGVGGAGVCSPGVINCVGGKCDTENAKCPCTVCGPCA